MHCPLKGVSFLHNNTLFNTWYVHNVYGNDQKCMNDFNYAGNEYHVFYIHNGNNDSDNIMRNVTIVMTMGTCGLFHITNVCFNAFISAWSNKRKKRHMCTNDRYISQIISNYIAGEIHFSRLKSFRSALNILSPVKWRYIGDEDMSTDSSH